MPESVNRPLRVFLCHAHVDRGPVYDLYSRLKKDGVDAWFDRENLIPGFNWEREIRKAVRETDVVVICLSKQFDQTGYRQKELRLALDVAQEHPEGEIFIIPVRLEECDIPEDLKKIHWADIFEDDGYEGLMRALHIRADKIGAILQANKEWLPTKVSTPYSKSEKPVDAPVEPKQDNLKSDQMPVQQNKNKSGARWLYSSIVHISVFFFGLIVGGWMGILFISLPMFLVYYFVLNRLAIVLLPTSNPEDRVERWKRFVILISYTWGIQFPLIVVDGHAWKKIEPRIPGDFNRDYPLPGLVWTRSHQAVAIAGGAGFKRIDGPGVVFTGKLERPEQIFDLRLQLRTNEIDVVSKDGIRFRVRVFTAFRVDPETWSKEIYDKLRPANAILRGADKPSYSKGSFPYSHLRVQAALGITSTKAVADNPIIYWDQWAINVVEDQARKVISQKNLDELWLPNEDKKFANALDIIAMEIKRNAEFKLRAAGILLIVARVVNFGFQSDDGEADEISKQQLSKWVSEWENRSNTYVKSKAGSNFPNQSKEK